MSSGARASAEPIPTVAYEERLAALTREGAVLDARSSRVSLFRGLTFLASAGAGAYGLFHPSSVATWTAFGVVAAVFLGLVVGHAAILTKKDGVDRRATLVRRGLDRARGTFAQMPARPDAGPEAKAPASHPYAVDLDIFGEASVFRLVDVTQTPPGETALVAWLSAPADAAEVSSRQIAARELAGMGAFREELALRGIVAMPERDRARARGSSPRPEDPLLAWAERGPALERGWLVRAAAALVPTTVLCIVLGRFVEVLGLAPIWGKAWLVPLALQVVILAALRGVMEPLVAMVASREAPFGRYRRLLELVEGQRFQAPRLEELRGVLRGGSGNSASSEMASLERILGFADLRHSGVVHVVANIVLLWDVWCALALDGWRRRVGSHARAWLDALGSIEALASLGTFAYEHPGYAWPEVDDAPLHFEAEALGHPLLPPGQRVDNDVTLSRPGAAMLVTGSNMSGKSTLLRAMGVAAVLALAGAPVCAKKLRIATLRVHTSMRISDSLERGVSHFYAEVERLKQVVDAAVKDGERVLFLLDEILHGTNSRERQIGAKAVVQRLVDRGAIGAVSSHDIGLAAIEAETNGRVVNVHFEETVEGDRMTFDFKLKPGVVTTANALRLMRIVGLDVDLPT